MSTMGAKGPGKFFKSGGCHLHSLLSKSGDHSGQAGRNKEAIKPEQYNLFEESGLNPEKEEEQDSSDDLDDTDLTVQYKGITKDGALSLDFEMAPKARHADKQSPREDKHKHKPAKEQEAVFEDDDVSGETAVKDRPPVPKLTIVMMVTGTRGDIQPFMALGIKLMEYGHRVRLASHAVYRDIVLECNLEFYPLGGDPKVLSEYIVKNRGIIPSSAKDAVANYKQVEAVVMSTYAACTEPDPEGDGKPFMAQAIISNPPCYGHIHCAEKLQVPLHMMFTMPWSPTKAFPQPLARLNPVADGQMAGIRNQLSYVVINELIHDGLLPIIQTFRKHTLKLPCLRLGDRGAHALSVHKIPFAYCWSPAVVPKPLDWFGNIDVVGYYFLNESERKPYTPPDDLKKFLEAGSPPVYIGFGSLVVDDPKGLSESILEAAAHVKDAGQRILLSKGWGKLGEGFDVPDNVLLLDAVPHDWLLPQCSAVVHHGGAGTTAAGLMAGNPTTVVPFFGDQSFWGGACARLGVGPAPIPIDDFTTDKLVDALEFMRKPEAIEAAKRIAVEIKKEDGVAMGVDAFHRHLPVEDLIAGRPTGLRLVEPNLTDVFSETGTGVIGFFTHPYKETKKRGAAGVVTGTGKGVSGLVWHPIKGLYHSGQAIGNDTARGVTHVHEHYIIRSSSLDDKDKQKLRKKKSSKTDDSKADDSTASGGSPRASLDDSKRRHSGLVNRLSNLMHSSSSKKDSQPLGDQENSEASDLVCYDDEDAGLDKPPRLMDFKCKRYKFKVSKVPFLAKS